MWTDETDDLLFQSLSPKQANQEAQNEDSTHLQGVAPFRENEKTNPSIAVYCMP
jgi:hypothetical protein